MRGDSDDAIDACENAGKRLISSEEYLIAAQQTPDPYTSEPATDSEPCLIWNTGSDHTSKPLDAIWAGGTEANSTCTNNGMASGNSCYYDSGSYYWECTCTGTNKSGTAINQICQSKYGVRDLIGNVWEWNSDTRDMTDYDQAEGWRAVRDDFHTNDTSTTTSTWWNGWFQPNGAISAKAFAGYSSTVYDDKFGLDGVYLKTPPLYGSGNIAAFIRGGYWYNGARAGVCSLGLANAPASSDWGIGFRCSR